MISLLDILIRIGISSADIEKAQTYQSKYGGRLEQILLNMGSLSSEVLPSVYAEWLGLDTIDLDWARKWTAPDSIRELPLDFLIKRGWIPLEFVEDGQLSFATRAPLDLEVNDWLSFSAPASQIAVVSDEVFGILGSHLGSLQAGRAELGLDSVEEGKLREMASEAPTVNLLNSLLTKAISQGASDLHFEPQVGFARVRFRIDGVLHEVESVSSSMALPLVTRLKILAGMDIGERRRPQDGKIEWRVSGEDIDIRASILPVANGESAVLRFLRKTSLVYDIKELGLSSDIEKQILEDLTVTSGVILLTGPTGSGKTTTLYTFLSRLNQPGVKVITLEDPIEYQLRGINQVQVQPSIGFDFATGLRSVVRQDPDIIMVGEIRDRETASVAMQSALTGHLVFSTVHTNDAPGAYTRLLDLGVEEFLLNAALHSIVGQRLARKLCQHCRVPHPNSLQLISDLRLEGLASRFLVPEIQLFDSRGCDFCSGTGYKGRVAIVEYFRCDDYVRAMQKGPDFLAEARSYAANQGWRTLAEDGFMKAMLGTTTISEVLRVAG
jgi:general secretion pathway protein E